MEFSSIKKFLGKYRKYVSDDDDRKLHIRECVRMVTGITLSDEQIAFTKNQLRFTGDSVLKNELFLHKEAILSELRKNGLTHISDIS